MSNPAFSRLNSNVSTPGSPSLGGSQKPNNARRRCNTCSHFFRKNPKCKKSLGHIALVILLAGYTAAGASVFRWLEQPNELATAAALQGRVMQLRQELLTLWDNAHDMDVARMHGEALTKLSAYELALSDAVTHKVPLGPGEAPTQWTYTQSIFFASTVLTTIGYGNITPTTTEGRVFCIFFALIGIPFTLTVIADLGMLMASAVAVVYHKIRKDCQWARQDSVQKFGKKYGKSLSAVLVVILLIVYIAVGGAIFMIWEDWSFLESFYFCFITMTTIGFGDLVPAQTTYMLVCTIYILVGLALTSTIIELIRRQYAQSWAKMRQLTNRLQGLTGPLAETLKRLSEQAGKMGGDGHLDPALIKELVDLKHALNSVNQELRRPSFSKDLLRKSGDSTKAGDDEEPEDEDGWPMEWDESWEERWARLDDVTGNNKPLKYSIMRILSETSIKV